VKSGYPGHCETRLAWAGSPWPLSRALVCATSPLQSIAGAYDAEKQSHSSSPSAMQHGSDAHTGGASLVSTGTTNLLQLQITESGPESGCSVVVVQRQL
jgi:hypothetical protein